MCGPPFGRRSISDVLSASVCVIIVALTAWPSGAADASLPSSSGACHRALLQLLVVLGVSCFGLNSKGPESAQSMGFIFLFPLPSSQLVGADPGFPVAAGDCD